MVLSLKAHLLKLPLLHLLFYLLPTALSSSITITTTTTTTTTTIDVNQYLNVQEAIEGTKFQPSSKVDHEEFSRKTRVSDHEWKLNLLHRDAISMSEASGQNLSSTHRHRVDERLERDVKRVTSLTRRVTRAAGAATKNGGDHKISDDGQVVEDFGSQVVSGMDQGSGEYFARIGVGSPPRDQYMVIDTGSDIMWVQCQPCSQCYIQSDPVFNPSDSATFAGVSCRSTVCERLDNSAGCHAGKCRYEVSYGDGSFTKGTVALETLTLGQTVVRNVAIGCGHMNRGMFTGAAGLMGLGGGTMSFVGQLRAQTGGSFGYCLVSRGTNSYGSLVFGRGVIQAGAIWVPLLHNPWAPSLYYVDLMGLGVGDTLLPITKDLFRLSELGDGGVVMDTGTAVTRLPLPAYEMLRDYFISGTAGIPRASEVSIFDTCYDLFGFETVKVPTVSFYFSGGPILTLPARNILIPVDEVGTFCFAFAPTSSGLSIIGNIQQEGIQISIDGANGLLGFGPSTC